MWVNAAMTVPAPTVASRSTQYGPTLTPSPSATSPSNTQPTSMATSRPQCSVPRTSMRAGSASETPERISASAWRACRMRSTAASCARSLMPRTSRSSAAAMPVTGTPSATAAATMSVR